MTEERPNCVSPLSSQQSKDSLFFSCKFCCWMLLGFFTKAGVLYLGVFLNINNMGLIYYEFTQLKADQVNWVPYFPGSGEDELLNYRKCAVPFWTEIGWYFCHLAHKSYIEYSPKGLCKTVIFLLFSFKEDNTFRLLLTALIWWRSLQPTEQTKKPCEEKL